MTSISLAAGLSLAACAASSILYATSRNRPSTITAGGIDLADHNDILKAMLHSLRSRGRLDDIILIDIAEHTGRPIDQVFTVADEVRRHIHSHLQQP